MMRTILVIDDFLDNVDQLRDVALKLNYPKMENTNYPGCNSEQRIPIEGIEQQVSYLLGEHVRPMADTAHAKFRLTLASDKGLAGVHIDASYWSGILYLSKPEDCQGGTHFYRHKRTGTERMPVDQQEMEKYGYKNFKEAEQDILAKDTLNPDAWEETMMVSMQYNRLVLLRPWLWHNAGKGFGTTKEDGRLIYMMFFESLSQK